LLGGPLRCRLTRADTAAVESEHTRGILRTLPEIAMAADVALTELSLADFTPLVGRSLDVAIGAERASLELIEAAVLDTPTPRTLPPFRLTLLSRSKWLGPQGIYDIAHPTLGTLALFTVPLGPATDGMRYEIILN
jgi:hypothetical protein